MDKLWKAIKPNKLKEDAVRLELLNAMQKVGRGIKKDYERTVKTWDDKPTFKIQNGKFVGPKRNIRMIGF